MISSGSLGLFKLFEISPSFAKEHVRFHPLFFTPGLIFVTIPLHQSLLSHTFLQTSSLGLTQSISSLPLLPLQELCEGVILKILSPF